MDNLGVHIDIMAMTLTVSEEKVARLRRLARRLTAMAHRNRRLVPFDAVRSFCGVNVSMTLALPLARFYSRSL